MRHPVYPFRLILKELRRDAGLAVLAAAEATQYGNYERWESGATRVGTQYLRIIARAFGVTDELWLLLYAWLVDRWTPTPGERAVDLAQVNPSPVLADLPGDQFAADTTATNLVLGSSSHLEVALFHLGARHQRGTRVVLTPMRRSPLPDRGPGESVLQATYADVVVDGLRHVSRALFTRGRYGVESPQDEEPGLVPSVAPVLTSPEAFEVLADELAGPLATEARWFAGMLRTQQQTLRAMVGAARGEPVAPEAVAQFIEDVAVGHLDRVGDVLAAAARSDGLTEVDSRLTAELAAMAQRVEARWVGQVQRELADGLQRLDIDGLFDAFDLVADARSSPTATSDRARTTPD
ncbi:MAG TPA: helix-turn-helix transcriptional regulator [Acidimicrobiales bacterium]|nr:helix-turn-helix transcriptional regulator [Acidimicrobiales bacterium]